MLRDIKRFTLQIVAGANLATIFMMTFVGFSDRFNPVKHQLLANVGLLFPVFLVLNFGFLLFWLCVKKKGAWLPVVGYLPVRAYIPFNVPHDIPKDAIKVMSYMCGALPVGSDMLTVSSRFLNISRHRRPISCAYRRP